MNILIIYTHPNHESFNAAILKQVQNNLNSKHNIKLLDLYAEKFNPVLTFDKNHRRRNMATEPDTQKYHVLVT